MKLEKPALIDDILKEYKTDADTKLISCGNVHSWYIGKAFVCQYKEDQL